MIGPQGVAEAAHPAFALLGRRSAESPRESLQAESDPPPPHGWRRRATHLRAGFPPGAAQDRLGLDRPGRDAHPDLPRRGRSGEAETARGRERLPLRGGDERSAEYRGAHWESTWTR